MPRFLEVLQGLPASGKSTYAKEKIKENPTQFSRINKDDLRNMMNNYHFSGGNEKLIIEVETSIIDLALSSNRSVIVDSTNLNPVHLNRFKLLAEKHKGVEFKINFFDTPLEECIRRNELREAKVPVDVIRGMYGKYLYVKDFEPTTKNVKIDLPQYILVDMDGTLADCTHREHYVNGESKKNWDSFFNLTVFDPVREDVLKIIEEKYKDIPRIIVTAREESWRPHTEKWLREKGIKFENILMRKNKDKRKDSEVKQEILDTYLDVSKVLGVVDDRPCVVRQWRENGLDVVDVGQERWAGRE